MAWQQGKLQGFLAYLEAQQTPRAMALRLALAPGDQTRGEPDEFTPLHAGDRARIQEQVTHLLQGPLDETALVALASACRSSAACDDRELASRMREDQSGNGYALLWSFEASRKTKDSAGMQLALQRMADAPRFIAYIRQTASRYRELTPLLRLVDEIEGTQPTVGFAYGRI